MLRESYPFYLANKAEQPNTDLVVTDKFTGEEAPRVALAGPAAIDRAIAASVEAAEPMRKLPAYARKQALDHCVTRFIERSEELPMALCIEAGKPINDARGEVTRLIDTFRIAAEESTRIYGWIQSAVGGGAKLLCGGKREGAMLEATLLEDVPTDAELTCQEAFGPVAVLSKFDDFTAALDEINRGNFGLQAGIFTRDIYKAHQVWDTLEVSGIVIGDVPSWRVDHMPYGGVKDSGLGREGIRFAIEDMTEIRLFVMRTKNN
jgi:acyl-CoA reductase-like NAD-dependent aldehyde dehydrogenase